MEQYHKDLIFEVNNATWTSGLLAYFVAQDKEDNIFGEYSLYVYVAPCPIKTD